MFGSLAFGVPFAASSAITHNLTSGLQGGDTDEYYHLTAAMEGGLTGLSADTIGKMNSGTTALEDSLFSDDGTTATIGGIIRKEGIIFDHSSEPYLYRDMGRYCSTDIVGAIKITLPFTDWPNDTINLRISGYDYSNTTGAWELMVGGFLNAAETWTFSSASFSGRPPSNRVRMVKDVAGNCCILIGDTTTNLENPSVNVEYLMAGLTPNTDWTDGVTVTIVDDLTGYTEQQEPKSPIEYTGVSRTVTNSLFTGEIAASGAVFGGTTPDASAVVDIQSTTQGFLPPRMTTTQRDAISSPVNGLFIYNTTTGKHEGYNGSWNACY